MPKLSTQASSKPRLQNDTLGDQALRDLYAAYNEMTFDDFRQYAENVVLSGGGKQPMKDAIIGQFYKPLASKTLILTKAQNFILAGMGLGV